MKELLILMNCLGEEIKSWLTCLPEITNTYTIKYITSYKTLDDTGFLTDVRSSDILIMNNVKSYAHLTYEYLRTIVKPTCKICRVEYIRFDGYYPTLPYTFHSNSLAVYDKSTDSAEFNDYKHYSIASDTIIANWNTSLEKLRCLDAASDIKFYNYFITNHAHTMMFRDNNHMTDFFIKYIVKQILSFFDVITSVNIDTLQLNYGFGHKFRVKPVLDCVKNVLGLTFDTSVVNMFNKNIPIESYYAYIHEVKPYSSIKDAERHFMEKFYIA